MIEEGLGQPWPESVRTAMEPFRQGHMIELPPVFYAADFRYPLFGTTASLAETVPEEERGEDFVDFAEEDRPPFGIITTQSCDLAEERAVPQQPWLAVAPVYEVAADSGILGRDFICTLDHPASERNVLVADVRIEMPLEKGLLVGRSPIESFESEKGYVDFANWLARRRGRPALASVVHTVVSATTKTIRDESGANRSLARRARPNVYKLMMAIEEGNRMAPTAIKIYVITRGEPSKDCNAWFDLWWGRARLVAEEHGLQLLPTGWIDGRAADLELVDDLIHLRLPF